MESVLLIVHVIIALAIIGLIMLQQGKGAEMGASFGGGASQTVFGAAGSSNVFSKMTALLVTIFIITSIVLAILSKESITTSQVEVPGIEQEVSSEISVEASASDDSLDALPEVESLELQADAAVDELPEAAEEPSGEDLDVAPVEE